MVEVRIQRDSHSTAADAADEEVEEALAHEQADKGELEEEAAEAAGH
jgi:hypothetical protein